MKSFEERKMLIYERSEEIKKKQKFKRNSAVSLICISVVCISIAIITRFSNNVNNAPDKQSGHTEESVTLGSLTADDTDGTGENYGYCGNTMTTVTSLLNEGEEYSFIGGDSITITDILLRLDYKKEDICRCAGHYLIETEFGKYYVNLNEAYARNSQGQATLNSEQIKIIGDIIERARNSKGE